MAKGGGCLGVIVALVAIGGLASMCGGSSSGGSGPDSGDGYGAESACESWVKDQLKAPSTADFSNEQITGNNPWTITGDVDAENSFGAQLRSTWVCQVRLSGDYYRGHANVLE